MGMALVACAWVMIAGDRPGDPVIEKGPYTLVYPANFGNRIYIPATNPLTKEGVYLGRLLFYEPLLSANDKISCASCHQQKKAFTDGRSFSPGVDQSLTTRNAMTLANLLWVKNLFWDGRAASLEEQAVTPLTAPHEMGRSLEASAHKLSHTAPYPFLFKEVFGSDTISGERIVKAIAQFERTLISANSRYDQYLQGSYQPRPEEAAGMALFNSESQLPGSGRRGAGCAHCHGGPKTFNELYHNNGLDSLPKDPGRETVTGIAADWGRFRMPTLRNIALTAPYMHDGRFKTLEEVIDHYSEHIEQSPSLSALLQNTPKDITGRGLHLTAAGKKNILSFLNMLTDSTFINDPRFSDPHIKQVN
ncbi:MAG TPA: cytochrome c peroxidase [Chitinophagaceae bacterium]